MKFVSFPDIESFHNAVKSVKQYPHIAGDGNVTYRGKIKLHGCFSKQTLVTMADGSQLPISKIKIGDAILSYDFENKDYISKEVTESFNSDLDKEWIELKFDNGTKIKCTKDHRFFTQNRGWIEAQNLSENDIFLEF